jgi:hypothetical protein
MRFTIKKNPSDHLWEYTIYTDIQITIKDEERLIVIFVNTNNTSSGCKISIYNQRENCPHDIDMIHLSNLPTSIVSSLQEALTLAHTLAVGTIIIL